MDTDVTMRVTVERAVTQLVADHPPSSCSPSEFLGARYDAGLAWVHFEPGFGGLGAPADLQSVVTQQLAAVGAPEPKIASYVGVHQAAAAVHAFASDDELKGRWLRPAFTNDEFWCQLFSEPDAGSDLANVSTTAVWDGGEWVVSGQKVWTSFADIAHWAILLARTDRDVPKHAGLTLFVLDMSSAGVDVRPLRTMDGGRHFNEVFLTDVLVPDEYRLGEIGRGWAVSRALLAAEREGIADNESTTPWLLDAWARRRTLGTVEPVYRDRVVAAFIAAEVSRLLAQRAKSVRGSGHPDALAPVVKVSRNLVDQHTGNLVMDLLGPLGTLGGDYDWHEPGGVPSTDQLRFLWSRARTIGGGTTEIMRNLIGERILGLPGEPRGDKDMPWAEHRRS
jgi:alkylation response protein AidB-like acyl-CoA dehydrogenase